MTEMLSSPETRSLNRWPGDAEGVGAGLGVVCTTILSDDPLQSGDCAASATPGIPIDSNAAIAARTNDVNFKRHVRLETRPRSIRRSAAALYLPATE